MAAFDIYRPYMARRNSTNVVAAFIASISNAVVAWNDQRQTRNALCDLTDRELADIGLSRGDIEQVARSV